MEENASNNNHQSLNTSLKSKQDDTYMKSREERTTEGITLLKKLREIGVGDYVSGFEEVIEQLRVWINNGPAWSG